MRPVIYSMSVSLDGFIAGPDGSIDWAAPDEELMAFHNDLVDEYRLFVNPIALGGGTSFFPHRSERLNVELVETQTFGSRVVYLRYRRLPAD